MSVGMTEEKVRPKPRPGSWLDWPAATVALGLALMAVVALRGEPVILPLLLALFGAVAWLIRAGMFKPRD